MENKLKGNIKKKNSENHGQGKIMDIKHDKRSEKLKRNTNVR